MLNCVIKQKPSRLVDESRWRSEFSTPHDKYDQLQSAFKSIKAPVKCKNTLGLTNL